MFAILEIKTKKIKKYVFINSFKNNSNRPVT